VTQAMNARTMARQHAGASLALFDALSRAGGGHRLAPAVRDFLAHSALPTTDDQPFSMKYDGYLAAGERAAWGFTVNSRFDRARSATSSGKPPPSSGQSPSSKRPRRWRVRCHGPA
jgi:hypothetical protein